MRLTITSDHCVSAFKRPFNAVYQTGVTLLELMVTLTIAAILITIAVPKFLPLIQDNRITGAANDFVTTLNLARAEAIKRGVFVFVCRTDDPSNITPTCLRGTAGVFSGNWSPGWLIYSVPTTRQVTAETDYAAGTDTLIRVVTGPKDGVRITSDVEGDHILAYRSDGTLFEASEVRFAVCDTRRGETDEDYGRLIRIPLVGRAVVGDTTTLNAEDCTPI